MGFLLYKLALPVVFLVYLPIFLCKLLRRGGFQNNFGERFGIFSAAQRERLSALDRPVWIHAVSVGEAVAAVTFVQKWRERDPVQPFVLSVTTTTGHAVAARGLPPDVPLIYYPIDFGFCVKRALDSVKPRMLIIFEVEIWPNMLVSASRRGIKVALVNGRMSDRSAHGYARHRWFFRPLFSRFCLISVQTEEDARRVRSVAGDSAPVHICGTMKFDQISDRRGADRQALFDKIFGLGARLVWTAGSTHPGEEELVAKVFGSLRAEVPALRLVLVPRHHERTPEVEAVLRKHQLSYQLLRPREGERAVPAEPVDVLLVNTTGELMQFYEVSDIVSVGKSMAGNQGGHNIIEPAIFGKPVIHGAAMQNFREVAAIFAEKDAALVVHEDHQLAEAVRSLADDEEKRTALGLRARRVVDQHRGAINRTLDLLQQAVN